MMMDGRERSEEDVSFRGINVKDVFVYRFGPLQANRNQFNYDELRLAINYKRVVQDFLYPNLSWLHQLLVHITVPISFAHSMSL